MNEATSITFTLSPKGEAITCLLCGRTSNHPQDVKFHYCGHCDVFHDDVSRDPWLRKVVWNRLISRLRYKDGSPVNSQDIVMGVTASGSPVTGPILEVNPAGGTVLIGTRAQHAWVAAAECLPAVPDTVDKSRHSPIQG